jgi:hypothetical protein
MTSVAPGSVEQNSGWSQQRHKSAHLNWIVPTSVISADARNAR